MSVKLLAEHHLEFLSLTGSCTGSSESTLVKMPHCWKTCVAAQFLQSMFQVLTLAKIQHSCYNFIMCESHWLNWVFEHFKEVFIMYVFC